MHHFDFYRLNEGGVVAMELAEVLHDPKAVVVVEWGDVVIDVLPKERVTVSFDRVSSGENHRHITVIYPDSLAYIAEGINS